jgi:outer membrane receptor for ferrienterochelin and colicin
MSSFAIRVSYAALSAAAVFAQAATEEAKIEPVRTEITVNEKIAAESPASIASLGKLEIRQNPGVNMDDRLRAVPGFTLFRRNSSLVANPTTQGISLRGLGSSGASRTLVIWDGIPANDPFGGWVYWTRFAPDELERIEIARGASTSVFGDRALGGSIQLFSRPAEPWRFTGGYEFGNKSSHQVSAGASHRFNRWAISTQGRAFATEGFYIVEPHRRGAADDKAGVDFASGDFRLDYTANKQRLFLKFDALAEERANGTVLQRNSTALGTVSGQYFLDLGRDNLSVASWHGRQEFRAAFSTILAGRASERLSMRQTVPAEYSGLAAIYRMKRERANILFGADFTRVEGYSIETAYPALTKTAGGGVQWQRGGFSQADFTYKMLRLFAGGRMHAAGVQGAFFSPSGGFTIGRGAWRTRGTVYRSFRAPTLNELHREFRAGNALTRANAALKPETSFGAELGFDYYGEHTRLTVTGFRNELTDLITNVTLRVTPALIERQRQNAGGALTRGIESNFAVFGGAWRADFAWLFADSRFASGNRIPQIPRSSGNAQLTWQKNRTLLSTGLRSFYAQYDDDANLFRLPGFATWQFTAQHQISRRLSAQAGWENLTNRVFYSAFTPIPQTGAPRLWRVGLRIH